MGGPAELQEAEVIIGVVSGEQPLTVLDVSPLTQNQVRGKLGTVLQKKGYQLIRKS